MFLRLAGQIDQLLLNTVGGRHGARPGPRIGFGGSCARPQPFDRIVDLVARHQLLSLIGALMLGLIAPGGLRRFARGTVVVAFWVVVLIYLLPVGALAV